MSLLTKFSTSLAQFKSKHQNNDQLDKELAELHANNYFAKAAESINLAINTKGVTTYRYFIAKDKTNTETYYNYLIVAIINHFKTEGLCATVAINNKEGLVLEIYGWDL